MYGNLKSIFIFCVISSWSLISVSQTTNQTTYKFGVVPQFEPRKQASIWDPILTELEKKTGFKFEMVTVADIPKFELAFAAGQFDFAYMNPHHAVNAYKVQKYEPIVREGAEALFGILVVAKKGPIKSIKNLKNKTIAFPAPNSLGASLLIRADLDRKFHIKFNPLWVKTHTSAYLSVVLGSSQAAGGIMSSLRLEPIEVQDKLTVLYQTRGVPPHPVVAHPRVPKAVRQSIVKAFLEMASTPDGAAMLSKIPIKKLIETSFDDYKEIKKLSLDKYYIKGLD